MTVELAVITGGEGMLKRKYQVFVSATYEDLIEERQEVLNIILKAYCLPTSMEFIPAANRPPWDQIEQYIRDCDYFVVISAGKYGSYFDKNDTISYTEKEFDYAQSLGKTILAFIHKTPANVKQKPDGTADNAYVEEFGSKLQIKLSEFREKLRKMPNGKDRKLDKWANKDDLKHLVFVALTDTINNETCTSKGWIRANEITISDLDHIEENKTLREKNDLLEANSKELKEIIDLLEANNKLVLELMEKNVKREKISLVTTDYTGSPPEKGSIIRFGDNDWRVLDHDVQNNKALILSERIIEKRHYHHKLSEITWSECEMRYYLNETFYNTFSLQDKALIEETEIPSDINPWFETKGGDTTKDRIFLLSIGQVVQYFGDSGLLENENRESKYLLYDDNNEKRVAYDKGDVRSWWWLRSPGDNSARAATVDADGTLRIHGDDVVAEIAGGVGVRPALWLTLRHEIRN